MAERWWSDDDRLLEELRAALRAAGEVPPEFVRAGKDVFTWHGVDAELAELTYDSARDDGLASALRAAEHLSLRALTFATAALTIELGVQSDSLVGQLHPTSAGTVDCLFGSGEALSVPIDEDGYFVFHPAPRGDFRLHCRPDTGQEAVTDWMRL